MNQTSYSLTAEKRASDTARKIRKDKKVPGIVYGYKVESVPVAVDYSAMLKTYRQAGYSALVDLEIEKKKIKVLIHDVDLHPVKRTIEHVDFYAVNVKEVTDVDIPLELVGESLAIKNEGGILVQENETITLRCLPTDIPHSIEVPLEQIKEIGDTITVADLKLDTEKFEIMDLEPDSVIAMVVAPRLAEEEETTEAPEDVEVPSEHGSENTSETAEGEEKSE